MNTQPTASMNGLQATQATPQESDTTGPEPLSPTRRSARGKDKFREVLEQIEQSDEPRSDDPDGVDHATDSSSPDPVDEPEVKAKPKTAEQVAEAAGLTLTELYDTFELNIGDGDTVTLAGAKKRLQDAAEAKQGIAQREAEVEQQRGQYVSDVHALGVLEAMGAIPDNIRQQANQHLMNVAQREANNFRVLHPEYRDETKFQHFAQEVETTLQEFGLSGAQFPVRNVNLYRLLESMLRWKKNSDAYTAPKPKEPPKPTRKSAERKEAPATVTVTGRGRERFAQVAQKIGGK